LKRVGCWASISTPFKRLTAHRGKLTKQEKDYGKCYPSPVPLTNSTETGEVKGRTRRNPKLFARNRKKRRAGWFEKVEKEKLEGGTSTFKGENSGERGGKKNGTCLRHGRKGPSLSQSVIALLGGRDVVLYIKVLNQKRKKGENKMICGRQCWIDWNCNLSGDQEDSSFLKSGDLLMVNGFEKELSLKTGKQCSN